MIYYRINASDFLEFEEYMKQYGGKFDVGSGTGAFIVPDKHIYIGSDNQSFIKYISDKYEMIEEDLPYDNLGFMTSEDSRNSKYIGDYTVFPFDLG